jgi:hypothetical protein
VLSFKLQKCTVFKDLKLKSALLDFWDISLDPYMRGEMKWKLFDSTKTLNPKLWIILFTEWSPPDPHFDKANAYLLKAYNFDKLKKMIKEIIRRGHQARNSLKNLHAQKTKEAAL